MSDPTAPVAVMVVQLVQIGGSLLILSGFVGVQLGRLRAASPLYLTLNLIGSTVLAVLAAAHVELGFLLLEGVWAIVSGVGLVSSQLRHSSGATATVVARAARHDVAPPSVDGH